VQVKYLQCVRCRQTYPPTPQATVCHNCREDINRPGIPDIIYDDPPSLPILKEAIIRPHRPKGIWAYEDLLPVAPQIPRITLGEGHTPLIEAPALASAIGMESLWIKNESQSPTGSFKDRIAVVVVAKALEAGARTLILVSSGNVAISVAAYGAMAGLGAIAIVSPAVSRERCIQIAVCGGRVIRVNGTSADRLRLCLEAVDHFGWFNANSPYNPYGPHGAKTISYELHTQGGKEGFDWVFSPVGFGCNIVGNWRGFEDLLHLGLTERLPRLAAVQAEGSPSLVRAFEMGLPEAVPGPQDTIAGGLSQVVTPNSVLALKALRASKGAAVTITDEEMLATILLLAGRTGIYAEPAGVTALAGLRKMAREGKINRKDRVVVLISGSGVKDPLSSSFLENSVFPRIDSSFSQLERAFLPTGRI
jgi:threonine synthase